ncbi:MAG: glycosyltransferase family 2 protein, partial [Muribaculaceae bacterium]
DHSGTICDEYAATHPQLVRVIHQQNKGVSAARNVAISTSESEFITFVDGDDWVEPSYLYTLYEGATLTKADLSCCGLSYDSNEDVISTSVENCFNSLTREEAFRRILLDSQFYGYGFNKLFRRSLVADLRFDESLKMSEDMWFVVSYATKIRKAAFNSSQLYHYRMRAGSATADFKYSDKFLTGLEVNRRLIDVYGQYAPQLLDIVISNFVKTNLNILGRMKISGHRDDNLKARLKQNIAQYWRTMMRSKFVSLSTKLNMWMTRLCPGGMLRAKQLVLKRKYHS